MTDRDPATDADRDDLAERVAELEDAVDELRDDYRPPRGPFGLPRPPTPRETLRFADDYAIPTAIAVLEANVRALELLQAALDATRRADEAGDRAETASRDALERADRALDRLLAEFEDGRLPRDPDARAVLAEARALRDEIDDRLADAAADSLDDSDHRDESDGEPDDGVEIDVEGELASIKNDLDADTTPDESQPPDSDTNG